MHHSTPSLLLPSRQPALTLTSLTQITFTLNEPNRIDGWPTTLFTPRSPIGEAGARAAWGEESKSEGVLW